MGRPRIPEDLRHLIVRMVRENPTWGEVRLAAELSVKLGILVSLGEWKAKVKMEYTRRIAILLVSH